MAEEKLRITLAAARVNAGLLQRDVSQQLGISVPTLVSWEAGKTVPTVDKAQDLASLYGVHLDDLIFCRET